MLLPWQLMIPSTLFLCALLEKHNPQQLPTSWAQLPPLGILPVLSHGYQCNLNVSMFPGSTLSQVKVNIPRTFH